MCRTPTGPANSPTRDLVLQNVHGTGHPGHPDRVLYVLHVLAQVGAPDGDTGASVHGTSQWLHLFQDMDLEHFHLPVTPGQPGDADPASLLQASCTPALPLKAVVRKGHSSIATHRVDEGGGALSGHSFGLATRLLGHAAWPLPLTPHTAVLGPGSLAAAAVPMSHRAVIQHHWREQRQT